MIKYYILLFVRNLRRQKLFSFINMLGLTVSIASTLMIYLYVRYEFSYDRFHEKADQIYRVNQTFIWGENNNNQFSRTGPGVAHALKDELPEVKLTTSIHTPGDFIISYTNPAQEVIAFQEEKILSADTNFFKMFSFRLLKGNPAEALREANTLVMTRSTAEKYFAGEEPLGKLVRLGTQNGTEPRTYEVTGIVEDVPDNSTIDFDVMLSNASFDIDKLYWSWVWTQLETFVLLDANANIDNVRERLAVIPRKRAEETLRRVMNISFDEYIKSGKKWELFLQPLTSIHLPEEPVVSSFADTGNIKIIYSFIGAAVFIVLLSCINFMNLSTAQFTRRIKEASIRKIMGLGKKELGLGYFLEALAFCFIALLAALALTQLLLPAFNLLTGKALKIQLMSDTGLIGLLAGLVLLMTMVSGSYPAVFLSGFNPIEAVRGKLKIGKEGRSFRNTLVVFQFSISIILIACTAIVFEQLNFVSEKDLGFDKENLVSLRHVEHVKNGESLAKAIKDMKGVVDATFCTSRPPFIYGGDKFTAEGLNDESFSLNFTSADEHYLPALGIKLKFGRNFSESNPGDIKRVILNETAIRRIGWKVDESVIGKTIRYPWDPEAFEIVGVAADFNYWSLEAPIEPVGIFHIKNDKVWRGDKRFLVLRMEPQSSEAWETAFANLNTLWKAHAGDTPFDYQFIDQSFADTFKTQQQFGKVLTVMATLAIMIAALGLLGMIIYALEQRTKEIGIRKVSGASVMDILMLISKGYTKLIIIAFVIGAPLSYWMMLQWLEDFAYRITPSFWVFLATGAGTLIVAVLITSYHSVKAALTNPVDVLKDE